MQKFLVTGSSSLGLSLFDEQSNITITKKIPGKLKYKNIDIYIGDYIYLENDVIANVEKRNNFLDRPRISNIDSLCIIMSLKKPDLSTYLLDSFLTFANYRNIHSKILFTKTDLIDNKQLEHLKKELLYYTTIGYQIYFINNKKTTTDDFDKFLADIKNQKSAFIGQTGVGKSTLLNRIDPNLNRHVDDNEIVTRGRHTTKDISLIKYDGGFIFDTPGFSDFQLNHLTEIDLSIFFPGYNSYSEKCKFTNCLHLNSTPGCNIINMVKNNKLSPESYDNYLKLFEKLKETKL